MKLRRDIGEVKGLWTYPCVRGYSWDFLKTDGKWQPNMAHSRLLVDRWLGKLSSVQMCNVVSNSAETRAVNWKHWNLTDETETRSLARLKAFEHTLVSGVIHGISPRLMGSDNQIW